MEINITDPKLLERLILLTDAELHELHHKVEECLTHLLDEKEKGKE